MLRPWIITRELRPILSTLKLAYFSVTDQIICQILINIVTHYRAIGLQGFGAAGRWGYQALGLSICQYIDMNSHTIARWQSSEAIINLVVVVCASLLWLPPPAPFLPHSSPTLLPPTPSSPSSFLPPTSYLLLPPTGNKRARQLDEARRAVVASVYEPTSYLRPPYLLP